MGNEQSQESVQAGADADLDDQEPFDLDAIEDSREQDARPSSSGSVAPPVAEPAQSPSVERTSKGRFKKSKSPSKKKKKKRKKSTDKAGSPVAIAEQRELSQKDTSPRDLDEAPESSGGFAELRRREPEQYGEYDNSDDSDEESGGILPSTEKIMERQSDASSDKREDKDITRKSKKVSEERVYWEEDSEQATANSTTRSTRFRPWQWNEIRYPCPYAKEFNCHFTTQHRSDLTRHADSHTKGVLCQFCGMKFAEQDSLNDHLNHHDGQIRARIPGTYALDAQELDEADEVEDPAEGEDVAADTPSAAKSRHPCPHAEQFSCEKTFARRDGAIRHWMSHTNPFICPVCNRKLARQDSLNDHLKLHSTAEITAIQQASLAVDGTEETDKDDYHVEPAEGGHERFPCLLASSYKCDKTYSTKKDAKRHARSHTQDLRCPLGCIDPRTEKIMTFAQDKALRMHLKRLHRSEEEQTRAREILLERQAENNAPVANGCDINVPGPDEQPDDTGPVIDSEAGVVEGGDVPAVDEWKDDAQDTIGVEIPVPDEDEDTHSAQGRGPRKRKRHDLSLSPSASEKGRSRKKARERQTTSRVHPEAQPSIITPKFLGVFAGKSRKQSQERQNTTPVLSKARLSTTTSNFMGVFVGSPKEPNIRKQTDATERRQSSIVNFAQPYTAGSTLRHPLFHPDSPDKQKRSRVETSDEEDLDAPKQEPTSRKKRKIHKSPQLLITKAKSRPSATNPNPRPREAIFDGPESSDESDEEVKSDEDDSLAMRADSDDNSKLSLTKERNVVCRICKRRFVSTQRLKIHESRPNCHKDLLPCEDCGEKFYHVSDLRRHEKASGHQPAPETAGSSGRRFSTLEEATIQRWVRQFRAEHDLTLHDFKEMMQASFRRGEDWEYDFITKAEFTHEYFDLLPNRDIASMRRYRNKHFNISNTSKMWTEDEDEDITRLHEELGPRWAQIGREMNRPGEMIRQRWKNKLSLAKMEHGEWSKLEETAFRKAVEEVRRVSDVALSSFNWSSVSKKMQTRTPQQCAGHWRAKYVGVKKGDKWVSYGETPTKIPYEQVVSKMEKRLSGGLSSSQRKQTFVSEAFVQESEDEDEAAAPAAKSAKEDPQEENSRSGALRKGKLKSKRPAPSSSKKKNESEADIMRLPDSDSEPELQESDNDEPELPRNPLATVTPGRTLRMSQVFNQTQANTSAKRGVGSQGPSQERPSPSIPIQRQHQVLLELGTSGEEIEQEDEGSVASADQNNKEHIPQRDGQNDSETDSEKEDENEDDATESQSESVVKTRRAKRKMTSTATSTSASTKSESGLEVKAASRASKKSAASTSTSNSTSTSASTSAATSRPNTATTTTDSDAESSSASASASDTASISSSSDSDSHSNSKSNAKQPSPSNSILTHTPSSKPWPQSIPLPAASTEKPSSKTLAAVSNAFMDSINASAQKKAARRMKATGEVKENAKGRLRMRGRERPVRTWVDSEDEFEDEEGGGEGSEDEGELLPSSKV